MARTDTAPKRGSESTTPSNDTEVTPAPGSAELLDLSAAVAQVKEWRGRLARVPGHIDRGESAKAAMRIGEVVAEMDAAIARWDGADGRP